jgi:3',5'-cyclic AMP phosphodiesterase CpdA
VSRAPGCVVVHLSDLHFGRADGRVVRALHRAVWESRPQIVAISGDLTQRARRRQFRRARSFIDGLPAPHLVVPGNHDVPLFNLFTRLVNPLGAYTRYITTDLAPTLSDEAIWMIGINTTRPTTWKGGQVDARTLRHVEESVGRAAPGAVRILVAHHPFDAADQGAGGTRALEALTAAGIDVFLTGHLHASYTGHTAHRYRTSGRSAVVVEAATATSTRLRDEANGFNLLRITRDAIEVETHTWDGRTFVAGSQQAFSRGDAGWTAA